MFLALREIRFSRTRYVLIVTIMLLVSFLVLFVTGLANGLGSATSSAVRSMKADHFAVQKDSDDRFARSQLHAQQVEDARAIVGADSAEPLGVQMTTVTKDGQSGKIDIALFGAEAGSWLMPETVEGGALDASETGDVVVDRDLADSGVGIGDTIVDGTTGLKWRVNGFIENNSYSHMPAVWMNAADWASYRSELMAARGGEPDTAFNAIALRSSGSRANELAASLTDADIITKAQAISAIPGHKAEQSSLLMMIVFLYIISAFVLAVFFYVITIQKTSQFGILKAIGARTAYLAGSVAGQVLVLSAGSLALSVALVLVMKEMLPAAMPFALSGGTILLSCALFLGVALLGGLVSIVKVARTDALDAIGRAGA
ncbi:ABC transporter permease [Saccharibacillus sp. CPCC 101409]|uniref:ABC transporter permease n=1 Tax=Saccharibacillus sp. CPCC 101409 TaxID=3058041 RepID=UPI002673F4CB|nr:ABC transporter permease [Saccharibacillus sp. CPCC 101409]MDO3411960.1 ABC transporter permease [Saccharibacillus sp. CPCC 101409]